MTDYSPTTWEDSVTDITAVAMNNADAGIYNAHVEIAAATPTGFVAAFPSATMPTGWLKCNGQQVSRTTYSALYAIIGITFGSGDGSTTFNVPDLRGVFVRGLDESRGYDTGRTISANVQDSDVAAHTDHQYYEEANTSTNTYAQDGSNGSTNYPGTVGRTTSAAGGTESRPKNIAVVYCIKT